MTVGSPDWLDEDPTTRLNVFVPGVMGAGILFSLGVLVVDAVRKLGLDPSQVVPVHGRPERWTDVRR